MLENRYDTDAWYGLSTYKSMWAFKSINADTDADTWCDRQAAPILFLFLGSLLANQCYVIKYGPIFLSAPCRWFWAWDCGPVTPVKKRSSDCGPTDPVKKRSVQDETRLLDILSGE